MPIIEPTLIVKGYESDESSTYSFIITREYERHRRIFICPNPDNQKKQSSN